MGKFGIFTKAFVIYNRRVLMIKRSANASIGAGEWDLPGGGLDFGEAPLDGIHREIKEETGLTSHVDRLLFATSFVNGERHNIGLVYMCNAGSDEVTLSDEHTEYMWATRQQLEENLHGAMLADCKVNFAFDFLNMD